MQTQAISIYTDGSCFPNPGGPGGWAAIIRIPGQSEIEIKGNHPSTTNNRMELTAVIKAIEHCPKVDHDLTWIHLYSDSQYVVNPINSKGKVGKWSKQENRTNRDLWEMLLTAMEGKSVKAIWVKGHDGHPENERCDVMAESERESLGGGSRGKPIKIWHGKRSVSGLTKSAKNNNGIANEPKSQHKPSIHLKKKAPVARGHRAQVPFGESAFARLHK
jgi:ribonuclease HI